MHDLPLEYAVYVVIWVWMYNTNQNLRQNLEFKIFSLILMTIDIAVYL